MLQSTKNYVSITKGTWESDKNPVWMIEDGVLNIEKSLHSLGVTQSSNSGTNHMMERLHSEAFLILQKDQKNTKGHLFITIM